MGVITILNKISSRNANFIFLIFKEFVPYD
jgi:hypothetical protein